MRTWKVWSLALVSIGACGESSPVGPTQPPEKPPTSTTIVREAVDLGSMLDDLQERVLPSLPEASRRTELSVALQRLRATFARGQVVEVSRALDEARASADRFAALYDDDATAVEFDNLRSALDAVAHDLDDARR